MMFFFTWQGILAVQAYFETVFFGLNHQLFFTHKITRKLGLAIVVNLCESIAERGTIGCTTLSLPCPMNLVFRRRQKKKEKKIRKLKYFLNTSFCWTLRRI